MYPPAGGRLWAAVLGGVELPGDVTIDAAWCAPPPHMGWVQGDRGRQMEAQDAPAMQSFAVGEQPSQDQVAVK